MTRLFVCFLTHDDTVEDYRHDSERKLSYQTDSWHGLT